MGNIKGGQEFANALNAMSAKIQRDTQELVEYILGEIEMQAIRDAPAGGDMIATQGGTESQTVIRKDRNWSPINQSIGYKVYPDKYGGIVFVERSAGEVAAWVEFGTGQSAAAYLAGTPPEWRATARRFYINGKGTIIAQPYFFPALLKYRLEFIRDMKLILSAKP